jgi:hypothetical protein
MRQSILVAAMMIAALAHPCTAAAQPAAAWFGTWVLNLDKSSYHPGPPPYKRSSFTIAPHGNGVRVTYDMVRPRGGTTHLEWDGKFDGQDYPVQGVEEFVTYAYARVDDRTYDVITKLDGRVAATSRTTLSSDGKTITTVTVGTNAQGAKVTTTTVYEKKAG